MFLFLQSTAVLIRVCNSINVMVPLSWSNGEKTTFKCWPCLWKTEGPDKGANIGDDHYRVSFQTCALTFHASYIVQSPTLYQLTEQLSFRMRELSAVFILVLGIIEVWRTPEPALLLLGQLSMNYNRRRINWHSFSILAGQFAIGSGFRRISAFPAELTNHRRASGQKARE